LGDGHQITRQLLPIIASIAKRAEPGRLGAPVRVLEVEQIIADLCGLDDSGGSEGDWHLAGQFTGSLAGSLATRRERGFGSPTPSATRSDGSGSSSGIRGGTLAISGSRVWALHQDRLYRESAASLCSGSCVRTPTAIGRRGWSRTTFLSPTASCRCASLTMSCIRKPRRAASCSRIALTSATTGSGFIVDLQQLLRRANHGRLKPHVTTNGLDPRPEGGIGDMSTIPGQEILDTVDGRDGDMQGIGGCL